MLLLSCCGAGAWWQETTEETLETKPKWISVVANMKMYFILPNMHTQNFKTSLTELCTLEVHIH